MKEITFLLRTPTIEVAQLLKAAGVTENGGEAKFLVQEGKVLVDGVLETRRSRKLTEGQVVELQGQIKIIVTRGD